MTQTTRSNPDEPPVVVSPSNTLHHESPDMRIQRAHGPFSALVATYALDVMNDQFFKQTAMLLVLQLAMGKSWQGIIQVTFMASFVLLAAPAGWLADRFAKRQVVIGSRVLELLAAFIGACGLLAGNWTLLLIGIGLFGLRGAVFSPAINGTIPELYPASHVTQANGILKIFTTAAMLTGIALAGFTLDLQGEIAGFASGRAVVAGAILLLALAGLAISVALPRFPAASPQAAFPVRGPWETVTALYRLRRDRLLATIIGSDAYFWFLGALLVQLINQLGITQLQYGATRTSYLVVAEVVGVAIGGVLCGRFSAGPRWHRILVPAALGVGIFLGGVALAPLLPLPSHLPVLLLLFAGAGVAGGMFLIPQEGFIQVRPAATEKGSVIASANFAAFTGMLLAGPASMLLCQYLLPSVAIAVAGGLTVLVAVWLRAVLPRGHEDV